MTIILLLAGLGLIVLGADWLVDGASAIARKAGVSEFVIGLTIVGFGTSCPELVVSLTGAIQGNADISIGNVIGSNIFNALFILGITAVILPVSMTDENRKRDIPVTLAVSVILVLSGMSKTLFGIGATDAMTRVEGIGFLILFAAYLYFCFKFDSKDQTYMPEQKQMKLPMAIFAVTAGLAGLIFGGDLFVDSATELARRLGVSDKFIAITILAGGTSFPELATCIVAAARHKDQLALGNILGSNVFNILLILGCSSVITPLSFGGMSLVDAGILILSCLLLLLWAYSGSKCRIDRWEGALMLLVFAAYYCYLFETT
ncbi:MAG: calcium/sodium antiporter [Bacteroidales bacterium]|uniref:calcium/sodium antiporter n=1 Tax=Candidatus Cryptobacteroides sp. TaxID=2952915 RepID=UPI002A753754|nr:calcium/sodium antiporter [Candidatus Cryptobacteroides sp.]MDD7135998.1 calcium/sodium antiporter [Bacteroidales bacterium]MDD7233915.1 calcium/sodium antiporter [Bacteroidales bacterium]MDD7623348.1 calcium/sodium antiporter [Bacteroidales bacterium]MDY2701025.1 calcium/sodium antiporter [Candidatus Cryptobacteroides sp.]MDY3878656.1 calcium/sodium antiporter [Candidatus Cryptobacteroides sp.]